MEARACRPLRSVQVSAWLLPFPDRLSLAPAGLVLRDVVETEGALPEILHHPQQPRSQAVFEPIHTHLEDRRLVAGHWLPIRRGPSKGGETPRPSCRAHLSDPNFKRYASELM